MKSKHLDAHNHCFFFVHYTSLPTTADLRRHAQSKCVNMQKSSFSSSPTLTTPTPPPLLPPTSTASAASSKIQQSNFYHLPRPLSTASTRATPAVIPLDYNYQTMSPSAKSTHQAVTLEMDNQYSSLFGDPVPPPQPDEYFGSAFRTFQSSSVELISSEEDALMTFNGGRLFSNVPYSSTLVANKVHQSTMSADMQNFDVFPTPLPRLQPPDIQILPNSSGGSSSDQGDSPNYALLAPQDILTKADMYELETGGEGEDVHQLEETYTVCDAQGMRHGYMSKESATYRLPSINVNNKLPAMSASGLSNKQEAAITRQCSNESYSSTEWFRPVAQRFPEFSRIPKLRPSSKNIMSMKRDELPPSPLTTILPDSNSSSSGEERLMDTTQVLERPSVPLDATSPPRPPAPTSASMRAMDLDLILTPGQYLQRDSFDSMSTNFQTPPPPAAPPPADSPEDNYDTADGRSSITTREMSPAIIKDSIATGGDYRVEQARLHKKTAFTIISERTPQSSRTHSPSPHHSPAKHPPQSTTSSTSASKPKAKPRQYLQRKSLTSEQFKLPHVGVSTTDDSPRPSVQFNMSGRYSPTKVIPKKSILQQRDSLTSSQDTITPTTSRRPSSSMTTSATAINTLPQIALPYGQKIKSCETLPLTTDPYRSAIPRFHRSSFELHSEREPTMIPPGALPRPLKPNPNPTRMQRGLLRILNHEETLSRIPLRSNWTSMDDLAMNKERKPSLDSFNLQSRRRSSSTSPERRSSTQTASDRRSSNLSTVTTSDFSFRHVSPTVPPTSQRRKSLFPLSSPSAKRRQSILTDINRSPSNRATRAKISKPSTLSPIIGTPNKDSSTPQSPETMRTLYNSHPASETPSDVTSRRGSNSRIPVRSRSDSRRSSLSVSRNSSPLKEFTAQLPLSGRSSRATSSRSPSRATARSTSDPTAQHAQITSRSNSRAAESPSASRASTRPISRGPPSRGPSRAGTRPNSRMEQRANSRLSIRSSSISPATARGSRGTTPNRRKSISLSPRSGQQLQLGRKKSISPMRKGVKATKSNEQMSKPPQRNSRSQIPTRGGKVSPAKSPLGKGHAKSPKNPQLSVGVVKRKSPAKSPAKKADSVKQPASAKKTPTSVRKPEPSVKRTPSSVGKQAATTKKQASNLKRDSKTQPSVANKTTSVKPSMQSGPQRSVKQTTAPSVEAKKSGAADKPSALPNADANKKEGPSGILPVAEQVSAAVLQAAEVLPAVTSDVTPAMQATPAPTAAATVKRQGSNMSTLVRMSSRLSLISNKKRTDSAQSRRTREATLAELPDALVEKEVPPSPLTKVAGEAAAFPAAILEKSQKTLENIQKTVTEATDEIHKTINENLTDLKTLETDMGLTSDSGVSPTSSVATVMAKPGEHAARTRAADGSTALKTPHELTSMQHKSPEAPSQPIEAAVSVLNAGVGSEAAERNYELDAGTAAADQAATTSEQKISDTTATTLGSGGDYKVDAKRRSPDGQGGSVADSAKTGSQEFLEPKDEADTQPKGCCRCCTKLCMPCRRSRCSQCCTRRNKTKDEEQPVLSATSSATTATNLEVIDETKPKLSCWQKLKCCHSCGRKKKEQAMDSTAEGEVETLSAKSQTKMETIHEEMVAPAKATTTASLGPHGQGKCGLCLSKIFCCRSVNKVDPTTGNETEVKKCCFCIPCRRKRGPRGAAVGSVGGGSSAAAWQDPELGIAASDASVLEGASAAGTSRGAMPQDGCCKRFWTKLCCCCRKKEVRRASDARRPSIKAPPTAEDTRRKLHVDLVEYTSKMKGAIPVLPLYLAWFCAICNIVFPGLGTLLSGFFCICVGIPRFSQYDSARARIGSFIINVIVAVAQFFCVLFCFVGWGWSIWWGTIMLKCARKLSKIKKVERLEMEEEQRQAEAAAAAAAAATATATAKHVTHVEVEVAKS